FSDELQQEWEWSEKYATQPEILRYAEHVADRFDLRRDMVFDTNVVRLKWSDDAWQITTAPVGSATRAAEVTPSQHVARFVVLATGCLSSANTPRFTDDHLFAGRTYHTGAWPHDGV
ncbi:MAG: cyclohexanone monooxygenase, partial [Actinomycetota bacterium]